MTTSTQRAQRAIDGDALLTLAVNRARQLAEKRRQIKIEEDRVKRVLAQSMREAGVTELTIDGGVVVRLTDYFRETVPVSLLRERFPHVAAALVTTTPVSRVELP